MSKAFEDVANGPEEEPEGDYEGVLQVSLEDKVDLRAEIFAQIALLKSIRAHLFTRDGAPKKTTEFKDVRSYLSSSTQLLNMLQKFEEVLNTDSDFSRVLSAMEKAMEEAPCPEFVEILKSYLTDEVQEE